MWISNQLESVYVYHSPLPEGQNEEEQRRMGYLDHQWIEIKRDFHHYKHMSCWPFCSDGQKYSENRFIFSNHATWRTVVKMVMGTYECWAHGAMMDGWMDFQNRKCYFICIFKILLKSILLKNFQNTFKKYCGQFQNI